MTDAFDSSDSRPKRSAVAVLAVLVVILAVAVVALSFMLIWREKQNGDGVKKEVKESRYNKAGWKQAGAILAEYMNLSVDPCDDFYKFACDRIQQEPDLYKQVGMAGEAGFKIARNLHRAITSNDTRAVELSSALTKGRMLYTKCLDNFDRTKVPEFRKIVDYYGGWPAIDNITKVANPLELMGTLHAAGFKTALIHHQIWLNRFNPNETTIMIGSGRDGALGGLGGQKLSYRRLQRAVAVVMGLKEPEDQLPAKVAAFWRNVQKYESTAKARHLRADPYLIHRMTVKEMKEKYTWFWSGFMAKLHKDFAQSIRNTTTMFVERKALDHLNVVLKDTNFHEFLHNYLILDMVIQLQATLPGSGTSRPILGDLDHRRKKTCADFTSEKLPHLSSRFYLMATDVQERDLNNVGQMTYNLKQAYKEMFKESKWLTSDSRTAATKKLVYMAEVIGWPTWVFDNLLLDAYYASFATNSSMSYLDMVLAAMRSFEHTQLRQVGIQVTRRQFTQSVAAYNAYHLEDANSINIPAGIFDKPGYSFTFPESHNFGMLGMIVGHEIGHGFQQRSLYVGPDGEGDNWMDDESMKGFNKTQLCLIDQYSKICGGSEGNCVNGKRTINENLADNAGLAAAIGAFERHSKESATIDAALPGLEAYSQKQIFYLAFARSWCKHNNQELFRGVHSPNFARVLGALRNSDDFAATFNCPVGSGMNPKEKCRVWR